LPKVLIEAGAACRAIVTTDTPGCRDAIIPNKSGLLVPPNNPEKLADAIQWLIEHPQERIAMGKAARELFEEKFQIEIIVKQHLEIYKILLQKKSNQFENYQ
jgi:glycosyltransferase involved in cell wall biosynthesis